MKKFLTIIFAALTFSAFSSSPLKLGHINSEDLMKQMPEVEAANLALQAEIRDLESQSRSMMTEYENLINEFRANENQWSDLIKQSRIRAIQDLEARIQDFQRSAESVLEEQRTNLFNPIIEKARGAIAEVAKEHKYTYIFDTMVGALLYYGDSEDILELVKKKLNLK
ncbi:MAG: OmpH family outer membrane protein [Bacteroidales bacterium]|jgi:outer membrane protein|nr:OmpH family outer membrane protein [Bacteroidales bacterium]